MSGKINILNIKINKVDMEAAIEKVKSFLEVDNTPGYMVVTPNSEMVVRAQTDFELARILNQADLSLPDGAGIVLASRFLKDPIPERVAGFDLMQNLFEEAVNKNYSIYLLGGKPGIVKNAKKNLVANYPGINICGINHGYLDAKEQNQVISEINQLQPDLLFVGMGVPLQEKFLDKNLDNLKVKVAMTVGGSFDVLSQKVKRAPLWMQNLYLEWFYRLLKEPSRLGRMMALPKYIFLVILQVIEKRWENEDM